MVFLPLELVGTIISEIPGGFSGAKWSQRRVVREEKADLASCTLVCRAWKPLATFYLFRDIGYSFSYTLSGIQLPTSSGRWTLVESGYNDSWVPYKTLVHFRTFLSQNPGICASVRRLHLEGYTLSAREDYRCTVQAELFTSVINMLPQLRDLKLVDVACSYDSLLPPIQRSMQSLHVSYSHEFSHRLDCYNQLDTGRILAYFCRVNILRVDITSVSYQDPIGDFVGPESLRPSCVKLGRDFGQNPAELLGYLTVYPEVCHSIKRLSMGYAAMDALTWSTAEHVGSLIREVSPTLEEFSVNITQVMMPTEGACFIGLGMLLPTNTDRFRSQRTSAFTHAERFKSSPSISRSPLQLWRNGLAS